MRLWQRSIQWQLIFSMGAALLAGILIVIGIAMIIIRGVSVPTQKKVVDIGSLEIRKSENKWIGWPTYAGALVAAAGVVLVVAGKKKG